MKHFHIITNSLELNIVYTACDAGFIGKYCDTKCRYPTYGNDCQSLCDCNATLCDYAYGCGKTSYQYY